MWWWAAQFGLWCCRFFLGFCPHFMRSYFLLFFCVLIWLQNTSCATITSPFALFSCLPVRCHPTAPIRNNPWYICVHFCAFAPNPKKHHVRGNFPGHSVAKIPCTSNFDSACLVFVSPCAPCTHPHLSAPLINHFYLFVFVYTRSWDVYMYNLI